MSEENIEIVRAALAALDQRDVEGYPSVASPEIELINPAGSRVLALFTLTTVGRVSTAKTSVDLAGVYSFAEGKIRRAHIFLDRDEALEARRNGVAPRRPVSTAPRPPASSARRS